MRPLHLLGLMPPDYRFRMPEGGPFMLPGSITAGDHEVILAYFQQVISEHPLPRVEVDWYTMLLEPSRRYLENVLGERGSSGVLVVVKVRQRGVDLRRIAEHPALRAFEHFAITNIHPGGTEELRGLLALTNDVADRAEELYERIAGRMGLRPEGWKLIHDFVRTLQNPVDVLETANALIEVQIEENPPEEHRKRILQRMLVRLLEQRPAEDFAGMIGMATRGEAAARKMLGKDADSAMEGLKAQGLVRDGKLRQWAMFLEKCEMWEGMLGREAELPTKAQLTEGWAKRVRKVVAWALPKKAQEEVVLSSSKLSAIKSDSDMAIGAIGQGRLARAREILAGVERYVGRQGETDAQGVAQYWLARAMLERAEGKYDEAEEASLLALKFANEADLSAVERGQFVEYRGRILRDLGNREEAEVALREALRLIEEGGGDDASRAITMDSLGRVLRDQGKLAEAERVLRSSLQLSDESADPTGCGITMHELALVLRDQRKVAEAEEVLRGSLRLKEKGGDMAMNRATTLDFLAENLRDQGKLAEAEQALREALRLKEESGATAADRGTTMFEIGLLLRDRDNLAEAEDVLRRALRLGEEGGSAATSLSIMRHELGLVLRARNKLQEAEEMLRGARLLEDEGAASSFK